MDPEEDWDDEDWDDEEPPVQSVPRQALWVGLLAFPFAVVLVLGVMAVVVAIVYGIVWLLIRAFASDYGG